MTAEMAGWRKFAQFMPNHILGNINGNMPTAVMYRNSMSYHLRENGACTAPGANDLLFVLVIHHLDSLNKFRFDEGTFF
jgi:hypothetical protein